MFENMYGKNAPEGFVRVGISVLKCTVWESTVSGNPLWTWEPTHWNGNPQSRATKFGSGNPLTGLGVPSLGVYTSQATNFRYGNLLTGLGVHSL